MNFSKIPRQHYLQLRFSFHLAIASQICSGLNCYSKDFDNGITEKYNESSRFQMQ